MGANERANAKSPRRLWRAGCVFLAVMFALIALPAPPFAALTGHQAAAQQSGEGRSLFGILFGRRKARSKEVQRRQSRPRRNVKRRQKSRTTRSRASTSRASRARRATRRPAPTRNQRTASRRKTTRAAAVAAPAAIAAPVEKKEDAKIVLVVGDFFAGGLADGLETALADVPGIRVVDRSNGLSGFVRTDIVDWPQTVPKLAEELKPAYIVAMAGSNDRQLMRVEGKRVQKREPAWDAEYARRIDTMGQALRQTGVPFTWVGLPPVRFNSMNRDFLVFNGMYRKAAGTEPGAKFVDVWDGFATADGKYTRSGPDVNGQITLLRRKDGINLTRAGRSRLAFYVEQDVRRALNEGPQTGPAIGFDMEFDRPAEAAYDPQSSGKTVVVNLGDPSVDGTDLLVGETLPQAVAKAAPSLPAAARSPELIRRQGRVDDYSWPPVDVAPRQPRAVAGAGAARVTQ